MAEYIEAKDVLNQGREKINEFAIAPALRAENNSNNALNIASDSKDIANNTDNRLDNIIAGEMQDGEVIDARRPFGGEVYPTLGERLDSEKAEVTAQLAQNTSQIEAVVEYNISDYTGNSLNEKWDSMRSSFVSWQKKNIIIPKPKANQSGAILHNNTWKWALTAPVIFDDKCNCATVWMYEEMIATTNISSGIRFDDVDKPENIVFPLGVEIRGDSLNGKVLDIGIDIRSSARLQFLGQTSINDCNYGVVIGGANQSAPADAVFDYLNVGFPKEKGVLLEGKTHNVNLTAKTIVVQILQSASKDAVGVYGKVTGVKIDDVVYVTDIVKNGYTTNDARSIVHIAPKNNSKPTSVIIGRAYGSNAQIGVLVNDEFSTGLLSQEIFIRYARTNYETGVAYAVDLDKCYSVSVDAVGVYNVIKVRPGAAGTNLPVGGTYKALEDAGSLSIVNNYSKLTNLGVYEFPTSANHPLGTIVSSQTANGDNVWIKYKNTGVSTSDFMRIDSQMFVPKVDALPAPNWNLRGKMVMLWGDSGVADNVYVCVKKAEGIYTWHPVY